MADIDVLFTPRRFAGIDLPNRIAMAPMTRQFSPDATPGENVVDYYRRRAEGGVGLIITEGTTLEDLSSTMADNVPMLAGDAALAGWRQVTDAVHSVGNGAKIFCQVWHVGALRRKDQTGHPHIPNRSPSGLYRPGKSSGDPMTDEEIADTITAFANAAANAKAVGFDGIEIHGAHGYLIDQFFWEGTNQRNDRFGGDMMARTAFAREVIKASRDAVGPDFPVLIRFSQWKQQDYEARLAPTPEALEAFVGALADAGVDGFHCSQRRYWEPEFEGSDLNLAGWTKKLSGKPTITVGSIGLDVDFISTYTVEDSSNPTGLDDLLRRLEAEEFDLAAVGRALIANPDWPQLVRAAAEDRIKAFDKGMLATLY